MIWLCPVNKSPMADHGYDISDYDKIDPMFGTLDDMKRLIKEADKRGIRQRSICTGAIFRRV